MFKKKNLLAGTILLATILANFYFGLPRLQSFAGVDEPLWAYGRVPKFWSSLEKMKWKATSLCDKPGITLAVISGIGLPFIDGSPKDYEKLRYQPKTPEQQENIKNVYYYLRLPVFLFTTLMLPVFYFFIRRLLGKKTALIAILFMGLSPLLLGIRLIINSDALLVVFLPLTILSFFLYQKENNRKFLYLTGFLLGLGLITKYVTNLLFPFLFLLIFLNYIFQENPKENPTYFKKAFLDYAIMLLIAIVTIFLLYPAAWVKPSTILDVTIWSKAFYKTWPIFFGAVALVATEVYLFKGRITSRLCNFLNKYRKWLLSLIYLISLVMVAFILVNVTFGMKVFDFQPMFNFPTGNVGRIYEFVGQFKATLLSSFYPLFFGLTPLVAILFPIALLINFIKPLRKEALLIVYLLCFILMYYLGSALSEVPPTVRYQIVLYPIASIISAIGLVQILNFSVVKKYFSEMHFYLLLIAILVFSIISLKSIQPYYLAYASDLLPKKYVLNLRDMGEGSWEIAQYLNHLPNAKNLKVWSDKGGVCESFMGLCSDSMKENNLEDITFDYFVITAGRESKSKYFAGVRHAKFSNNVDLREIYNPENAYEFRINIDNRPGNYLKVIKADKLKVLQTN